MLSRYIFIVFLKVIFPKLNYRPNFSFLYMYLQTLSVGGAPVVGGANKENIMSLLSLLMNYVLLPFTNCLPSNFSE